jgi:Uma2 family endonuclease
MEKTPPPRPKPSRQAARLKREADALRANLRKRKDQARARQKPQQEWAVSERVHRRMTSDEFIAWAMQQPETCRYELFDGEVLAMAPERSSHALTKAHFWRLMTEAIEAGNLPCQAYPDGMTVEVDEHSVFEPDAFVRCGEPLPPNAIKLSDPLIVVEVLSPSTSARDVGAKLEGYFRLPSVRHYLIVRTENRTVIHHERGEDGIILTRIVREGPIVLTPPGITLTDCFPPGVTA